MKIILSRKAFDSSAGGCANPILPDGRLLPLPIPDRASLIRYEQITLAGTCLGDVVCDLTGSKQKARYGAHLDPDLVAAAYPRTPGWRPLFGQTGSSQTHLQRHGVGPGDLFLFFGWFRKAEKGPRGLRFVQNAPHIHLLWGWLQVDSVFSIGTDATPLWAAYHPHVSSGAGWKNNCLYAGRKRLQVPGMAAGAAGAGVFSRYRRGLQLTKDGAGRSLWSLPSWFAPTPTRPALGYHKEPTRWTLNGDRVDLQTVGRGQEFVLDTSHYPEALDWASGLIGDQGNAEEQS